MAYRILASGLDRRFGAVADLPVWDLGLQDRDGAAALALGARLPRSEFDRWLDGSLLGAPGEPSPFAMAWTLRGSPHLHRRRDLPSVAEALWPADEKDALARLVGSGKTLVANGSSGLDGYREVASGMRRVVTSTMKKSAASAALTAALPAEFSAYCAPCGSTHVMEMLFRCAALPGGLGLVPGVAATLAPLVPVVEQPPSGPPGAGGVLAGGVSAGGAAAGGVSGLVEAYLTLYGAATAAEVATHLGTSSSSLRAAWPEFADVSVGGSKLRTTAELAAALETVDVDAAAVTRLLPPGDPLLQPRDRSLLVEDAAIAKALWPAIGPAGAVLVSGEIVGFWRPKKAGRKLTVRVTSSRVLTGAERAELAGEAELLGPVRDVDSLTVDFS